MSRKTDRRKATSLAQLSFHKFDSNTTNRSKEGDYLFDANDRKPTKTEGAGVNYRVLPERIRAPGETGPREPFDLVRDGRQGFHFGTNKRIERDRRGGQVFVPMFPRQTGEMTACSVLGVEARSRHHCASQATAPTGVVPVCTISVGVATTGSRPCLPAVHSWVLPSWPSALVTSSQASLGVARMRRIILRESTQHM
ncbi:hypothetical protein BHM03_00003543 [Ensete ventricosum]|nr:hypothetical protein BHM03_00003543 [Ensete ventricosum]